MGMGSIPQVQGFIDKTKKDLNFEKFDGDCFSYKELRLNNIQRVFSMILNKPEYRYSQSSDIITTTFKKLSQLILPRKYESIHIIIDQTFMDVCLLVNLR